MKTLYFSSQQAAHAYAKEHGLKPSGQVPPPPGSYGVTYCSMARTDSQFVLTIG